MPEQSGQQRVPADLQRDVALASFSTFELGGLARYLLVAQDVEVLRDAIAWARDRSLPWVVLGGGSNVVISDAGFPGLVIRLAMRGVHVVEASTHVMLTAAAGEVWDEMVARSVACGWAGIECLAGIPGLVGATPIQNVGAYGQEVGEVIEAVQLLDSDSLDVRWQSAAECGFAYRDSVFKRDPGRAVVVGVRMQLKPGGAPRIAYAELERALAGSKQPSLRQVRDTVLRLRRAKSMVLDAADPNRRSAGSFFTNPIVPADMAAHVTQQALALGLVNEPTEVPCYPMSDGRVKLAAGWLVERSGFQRGLRRGRVGLSSAHALALIQHGRATSAELLMLAREIRDGVVARFGVRLVPEPVLLGFESDPFLEPPA